MGQKVRVMANTNYHEFKLGSIVTLEREGSSSDILCRGTNGETWWVLKSEMAPIDKNYVYVEPKYITKLRERCVKRVENGVAFLDKTLGRKTWLKKIKLSMLKLNNSDMCVAGQALKDYMTETFGEHENGFETAMEMFGAKGCIKNGFLLTDKESDYGGGYDILQEVWYNKIKSLKDANKIAKSKSSKK